MQERNSTHPLRLLRTHCDRPRNCTAKRDDEISALDLGCQLTLPWEVMPSVVGRYHALIGRSAVSPLTLQDSPWTRTFRLVVQVPAADCSPLSPH
jgi:hypothetical protein